MFYSIKLFGPDLSIGATEGFRIITKQASKLSCVSLANHEIAVSSFEPVQLRAAENALGYTAGSSRIDLTVL